MFRVRAFPYAENKVSNTNIGPGFISTEGKFVSKMLMFSF